MYLTSNNNDNNLMAQNFKKIIKLEIYLIRYLFIGNIYCKTNVPIFFKEVLQELREIANYLSNNIL